MKWYFASNFSDDTFDPHLYWSGSLMRRQLHELVVEMVKKEIPLELAKREFERAYLMQVVEAHEGNQSAAARSLGIHRNTLSKKLEPQIPSLRYPEASC